MMRAWLKRDVEGGAACAFSGLIQRQNLSVLYVCIGVIATPYNFTVLHQHRAHRRIRTGAPYATTRQFQRLIHPSDTHVAKSDAMNLSGSKGNRSPACSPTPT